VIELYLKNLAATDELAGVVASLARVGDLVVLAGQMGAGKTAFAQAFGRGLAVDGPVTSPTFTLAHTYEGRLRVHHLDVYRLDRLGEVADLAVDELLLDGVVLVEWGDVVADALPPDQLHIELDLGDAPDERRAFVSERGHAWSSRMTVLRSLTEALTC
jgi:tRNA threonylcarbamoyl adenosine modification protein YjeE